MKLSIAIPTYEMKGEGIVFLHRNLESIKRQILDSASIAEVVISDHSQNDEIEKFAQSYSANFPIQYHKNRLSRGNISTNTNVAIEKCSGHYVKILFQDDFLVESSYLETVASSIIKNPVDFVLTGATHTTNGVDFFDAMSPQANEFILFGENTISSPSTLIIKKSLAEQIRFDENLKLLMDCDYYHQLFSTKKSYILLPEIHVANGVWTGQTHSNMNGLTVINEVSYLLKKYQADGIAKELENYSHFLKKKDLHLARSLNRLAIDSNAQYNIINKMARKLAF